MSELRLASEKRLRLFSGRAFPELAEQVASELGIPLTPTAAYDFANGEIFVRFEESVRGSDAFASSTMAAAGAPDYYGQCFVDAQGQSWQEINLRALAQSPQFLSIGA